MLIIEIHTDTLEENTSLAPTDEISGGSTAPPVENFRDQIWIFIKALRAVWHSTRSHNHHGNGFLL